MNPVFDVLIRLGKARLARALKPPSRDKLDEKSRDLLVQAVWLLERLKDQPKLSPNDLINFGACAAVIGHFVPLSKLPLTHSEVASRGGIAGRVKAQINAKQWHDKARPHWEALENESPGLPLKKLAEKVIERCRPVPVDTAAMIKFLSDERKNQSGSN